jgi:uncharacterized protein YnzC (UPF0291/DUF896 family)
MTEEMEYMNISQYCLNLIKNNLKLFFEAKYKDIIEKEYKSSIDSFYDVMFYFTILKNNINQIKEMPNVIINTVYSLKIFRNKIAHQVPITLREFYRFVDDTQIIIETLNVCDENAKIKIENTRKEIIKRMNNSNDNNFVIGSSYNVGNTSNNSIKLNLDKFNSDSDIEMGDFTDENIFEKNDNIFNVGKNYNDFNNFNSNINSNNNSNSNTKKELTNDEIERRKKIDKNYEEIMKNNDKKNFMQVKKVDFSDFC